jgi:hypothetical protein
MSVVINNILLISRGYIPDPITRIKVIRNEEIGRLSNPTTLRETFYIKHPAIGSVSLYVDPYTYSSTASLKTSATTDRVFLYNATLQSCTFPKSADKSIRPAQFKLVYASYEYTEKIPYIFSNEELVSFLPNAISYLNNNFSKTFVYITGTISTFTVNISDNDGMELIARSLAVIVRKYYASEQMRYGLGVAFKGPMTSIDSKTQLNVYNDITNKLEQSIKDLIDEEKLKSGGSGQTVDIYNEDDVTT